MAKKRSRRDAVNLETSDREVATFHSVNYRPEATRISKKVIGSSGKIDREGKEVSGERSSRS